MMSFIFFFWYIPAMIIAPIALAKEEIRLTIDQLVVLKPRSAQTGAMNREKQLLIMAVGINDRMNAATSTPQPLNFLVSIVLVSI